ncbi:MAG: DHA2 family efflux MFS transporter permease subunit [Capsulimonadaceae bacterium]|nr:DHA2 family efflux MFS transporter permease subunit [Capsulimonadaceae bacterium]
MQADVGTLDGMPAQSVVSDYEAHHPAIAANKKFRWWILIGLVVSAVLEVMDTSILNVALPQMAGSLGATTTDIAWVSTAYLLANVVVLPMTAWVAQRFGRKNYLVASIIVFSISRLMCAFSHDLGTVIVWRLIQGAAGASLISISQAVIADIFPAEQQGMVQAIFGIGLVVAPAVAPLLGGWIVDNSTWRVVFYIHVPIALFALYLVDILYTDASTQSSRAKAGKLDVPGIAFLAIGFGSLQYVLEEGQRNDWFNDAFIARVSIAAVCGIIAMIIWELWPTNKAPIVNLRVYGNRGLWSAVVISFMMGVGMYAVNYAFTMLVEYVLGFTPIKAGLAALPLGAGAFVGLLIIAAVTNLVDVRILVIIGLLLSATGSWMLGFCSANTGIEHTWICVGMIGFGIGFAMIPVTTAAFAALEPEESADGAAQLGLGRQLGGSFGIAILNTYISHMNDTHRAVLLEHLTRTNQTFTHAVSGMAGMFSQHGMHGGIGQAAAMGIVSEFVQLQSAIMAYNNGFQLVSIIFLACIPLTFLLKAPPIGQGSATPAH